MDLSHWDLVDRFTLWEAACLAGGVDPKIENLTPEQKARVALIQRELDKADDSTINNVLFALTDDNRFCEGETLEFIFASIVVGECPLPSSQLIREVKACLRTGGKFNAEKFYGEGQTPEFSRARLQAWFDCKGYKAAYSFVSPSKDEQGPILLPEKPLSATERNSLLTIIAALCDYSAIKIDDRGAASQIAKLTEELGARVSDDTVRRWLKIIPNAVESRMK